MAQTSSRSFSNNSGLNQYYANQPQGMTPNAQQRLGDSATTRAMQDTMPWALGLSERPAQGSGRSFYDPGRQAERWVRGTGSRDQTQAAFAAQGYREAADPIEAARRRAFGPKGQGFDASIPSSTPAPPSPPMPNLFSGSMTNPAMAQSQYSIGAALNGNGFMVPPRPPSPPSPPRPPTSVSMAPQIYF